MARNLARHVHTVHTRQSHDRFCEAACRHRRFAFLISGRAFGSCSAVVGRFLHREGSAQLEPQRKSVYKRERFAALNKAELRCGHDDVWRCREEQPGRNICARRRNVNSRIATSRGGSWHQYMHFAVVIPAAEAKARELISIDCRPTYTYTSQRIALSACVETLPREETISASREADAAQGGFVGYHYDGRVAARIHRADIASLPNGSKGRGELDADYSNFEFQIAALG